jgi:hypothetical protein
MHDLLYLAIFVVCCAATGGLAVLCEGLMPQENRSKP